VTNATAHTLNASSITLNNGTITSTTGPADWGSFYAAANRTITAYGATNVISTVNLGIVSGATLT